MNQTSFYLPDFYYAKYMNLIFHDLMKKYPECFYEDGKIKAVYGCFPGSIWNGGRLSMGSCQRDNILRTIEEFNSRDISLRFTFTNPLLEEKHLYDTFCNLCMKLAGNGKNEILVNSPLLEDYLRTNYPDFTYVSSTTKCLTTVLEVEEETKKKYSLIVLDNSFNNAEKLFLLKNPELYELVADSFCQDSCPDRFAHYEEVGRAQLEFRQTDFNKCSHINRDFYALMNNRSFLTVEEIHGRYKEHGFCHFKLDGRGFNRLKVAESYIYYFVLPEHRDRVRLAFFDAMDKFR